MNLVKRLEEIAKENGVSTNEVYKEFTANNKWLYEREYGKFLSELNSRAVKLVELKYKKN